MDTVANMLTILVNAQRVGKERVAIPHTRFKEQLANILKAKGAIARVRVQGETKPRLIITLSYKGGRNGLYSTRRLSRPGRRVYTTYDQLPYTGGRPGFYVVSTSQGLLDEQAARARKLGGELICAVWQA